MSSFPKSVSQETVQRTRGDRVLETLDFPIGSPGETTMMPKQSAIALAAVFLTPLAMGSVAQADEREVSWLRFGTEGWTWVPTTLDAAVESFVGLRTDTTTGENITAVWLRHSSDGKWESWAWSDQDQSKAIASVKSVLGLADSTDSKWPVAPGADPAAIPERLTKGVLESDPFAQIVEGLDDPALLVLALESSGWRAAWIDIWDKPCADVVVLDTWAMAVEATEIEISDNGGARSDIIDATFANTVTEPCGTGLCNRVVESHGRLVLLREGDVGSIIAEGVSIDDQGISEFLERSVVSAGQVIVEGFIENTGIQPAVVLLGNGDTTEIEPGEEVAVVETWDTCKSQCRRLVGWVHDPGFGPRVPIYCIDDKCYCCCWSGLQPQPPTWLDTLPDCPCQIGFDDDGDPINPDPAVWKHPKPASPTYHPGAVFCMRSKCPDVDGGPGQQCCYGSSGHLVTVGGGAGTPDIIAPCGPFDAIGHNEEDVQSYTRCKRAGMLDCYLRHRPPNNGSGCACNPPTHPHCTDPPTGTSCDCD